MASLQEIRRRIESVKGTQKITRAMKMVAAAKLHRAHELLLNTRPYAYHMRELIPGLSTQDDRQAHPLLRSIAGNRTRLIVITSDRGICGSYNAAILQETLRNMRLMLADRQVSITVVGRKGAELFRRRQVPVENIHAGIFEQHSANAAVRIVDEFVNAFLDSQVDEVLCLYNEYKNAAVQAVVIEKMLPYEAPARVPEATPVWIFEPDKNAIIMRLLRANLYAQMHRILHEAAASEQGARMAAMDSATRNAGDVIATLSLEYNRARQDAITREVVEVISGTEAL